MKRIAPEDIRRNQYLVVGSYKDSDDEKFHDRVMVIGPRRDDERTDTRPIIPGIPVKVDAIDPPFLYVRACKHDLSVTSNHAVLDLRITTMMAMDPKTIRALRPKKKTGAKRPGAKPSENSIAAELRSILEKGAERDR